MSELTNVIEGIKNDLHAANGIITQVVENIEVGSAIPQEVIELTQEVAALVALIEKLGKQVLGGIKPDPTSVDG